MIQLRDAPVAVSVTRLLVTLLLVTLAVASCSRLTTASSPSASPGSSSRLECERAGGAWRPALGVCDIQAGGGGGM